LAYVILVILVVEGSPVCDAIGNGFGYVLYACRGDICGTLEVENDKRFLNR
jgi:hypothetical protein